MTIVPSALADAASGRKAFDGGDYERAISEWQSSADHGDPEAQLGLGTLYEQGLGNVKQDYMRADYWYRKAAGQGNTEAQYRLALIWAAGGDDFAPDLIEAYKWILVAEKSKGVWGSAAADVETQLDKILTASERESGKERSAAWQEALAAKKEDPIPSPASSPAVVASRAVAPAPAPRAETPAGGCPGWPFPTLPCTEQFPALGGQVRPAGPNSAQSSAAPPLPAGPKKPIDELTETVKQIDCATLTVRAVEGSVQVVGAVPDVDQKLKVTQTAARLFPNSRPQVDVDVVPPPLCETLVELASLRSAGLLTEGGLTVRLNAGSNSLKHGDKIELTIRAPAYPVNIVVDYFSLDGKVLHLVPANGPAAIQLAAGTSRIFGRDWIAGGAPFGTELIGVFATSLPLPLGTARPVTQPALDYLRELRQSLGRSPAPRGSLNLVAALLLRTSER